ncbi:MAG: hypothetical protein PVG49_16055 [Desulfobacteraceae bacterium]|jgi:F420-non-reducing hydrogenase small subunit
MSKPKLAMTWLSGCGGCEESILDLGRDLFDVLDAVNMVYWPVAVDARREDLGRMADGEITACLINGAVRTEEDLETARLLRRKSRVVLAHGSCAHLGGVYGLANLSSVREILDRSYPTPSVSTERGGAPAAGEAEHPLPKLLERVFSLDQVVKVDAVIPGCPPASNGIRDALSAVVGGRLPTGGEVFADTRALCDTCPRRETRRKDTRVRRFKRFHESSWDPEVCFLEQGLLCLGPATRGGCEARCIRANVPCRGCYGPVDGVRDTGGAVTGFVASLLEDAAPEALESAVASLPDPAGLFYRYSLPSSLLGGRLRKEDP